MTNSWAAASWLRRGCSFLSPGHVRRPAAAAAEGVRPVTSAPLLGQCLRDRGPSREPVTAVGPFSESVRVCLIACHLEPAPRCWSPACSVTKAWHGDGRAETCGRARKGRLPTVSDPGGTGASGMSSPSLEASRQRRNVRLGVTPVPLFIPQCPHARSTGRLCPPGLGEQTPGRCVCAHTRDSGALRACARPRLWRGKSPPVPWGLGLSLALAPGLQLSRWVQGLS